MYLRRAFVASILASSVGCGLFVDNSQSSPKRVVDFCGSVRRSAGAFSPCDYLCDRVYKSLVIEIDAIDGVAPIKDDDVVVLEKILSKIIDKPLGITHIKSDLHIDADRDVYSMRDILAIARKYRSTSRSQLSLYVLYLNGIYTNTDTAGLAIDDGIIAIFREFVPQEKDKGNLMHEIGHHLGLVNNGIPQLKLHEDKAHPQHDVNSACVMFYRLRDPLNYLFDRQCLDDISAAKHK